MDDKDNADPKILYHYTDASGLIGIVDKPSFPKVYEDAGLTRTRPSEPASTRETQSWLPAPDVTDEKPVLDFTRAIKLLASDVRFMNDHAELRFAGKIFAKRFDQAAKDPKVPKPRRDVLVRLAKELRGKDFYGEPVQVFAACLSSHGDQLSQWRGYAGGTGGYAIGVSRFVLDHFCFALPPDPFPDPRVIAQRAGPALVLKKVSYDKADAKKSADSLADDLTPIGDEPLFWPRFEAVAEMARFKHKGFEEEQEWRFIYHHAPKVPDDQQVGVETKTRMSAPTEFRPGRFGIVPYLPIAINLGIGPQHEEIWGKRPKHPIEKLIVGPSPDQALRVSAARQLLETNGHDPDVVKKSPIPFRG